ncbi:MAG: Nif11-like leader peptide family natural product precursor [Coriobacteriia bacterium]|nr:Nif11-like leader peptide family natural product precursor [Coriobacteriia bacterium]
MKDAKQFVADLKEGKELAAAFEALAPEIEAKAAGAADPEAVKLEVLAAFAKEHGYEFDPEELAVQAATNREVDDSALETVAGGGRGYCDLNYGCELTWNSCMVSNECNMAAGCKDRTL